jgi:hypothetical protein
MSKRLAASLDSFLRVVRYLYFLRFSLILWLFAVVLIGMNMLNETLTSGILVPEFPQEYLCVGFFLVSAGFAALICARVTLINGPERWTDCPEEVKLPAPDEGEAAPAKAVPAKTEPAKTAQEQPPAFLKTLLVNDRGEWEWVALFISLAPSLLVFVYLAWYGNSQGVAVIDIVAGLLGGLLLAVIVWCVVNVWYYLTYDAPVKPPPAADTNSAIAPAQTQDVPKVELGTNAARTLLFPRALFRLPAPGQPLARNRIEGAETILQRDSLDRLIRPLTNLFISVVGKKGYAYEKSGKLFEAQVFAFLTMFVLLGLYFTVWPLSAPVPAVYVSVVVIALLFVGAILVSVVFWSATPPDKLLGLKLTMIASLWIFWIFVAWLYVGTSTERFPIFATLMLVVTTLCWFLAGLAFFLDRYRVPLLTVLILLVVVPRLSFVQWLFHIGASEEHYFSTVAASPTAAGAAPTPSEILLARLNNLDAPNAPDGTANCVDAKTQCGDLPLIVVTATGGGLHASVWTATMLARLESEFANDADGHGREPFHKHLLLLSTVSGGSVGLSTYLHGLHNLPENQPGIPSPGDMLGDAQCSSLEAVGWGLIYYDLPKALVPGAPYFLPLSSGNDDLNGYATPLFKDRTWALREGFERNHDNVYCKELWKFDSNIKATPSPKTGKLEIKDPQSHFLFAPDRLFRNLLSTNRQAADANKDAQNQLSLRSFLPTQQNGFPAFTMNTTTVEQGARFLLANYRLPHYPLDAISAYPAQSFLDDFGADKSHPPDLPLSTGAQLSATFPIVSSAARAPKSLDTQSVHFVDGGYFDNDGTGSAMEFVRYALASSDGQSDPEEKAALQQIESKVSKDHPLRILWIEIRNSGDPGQDEEKASGGNGAEKQDTNLLGQLSAVPEGFWNAGHESVTGRNRQAMGLLEQAVSDKLQIHRVILADTHSTDATGTDPLNWSLTPLQRAEVRTSADYLTNCYVDARTWFYNPRSEWDKPQLPISATCPSPPVAPPAVALPVVAKKPPVRRKHAE